MTVTRPGPVTSAGSRLLGAALRYAARGWQLLPLWQINEGRCACGEADCVSAGKHPIGSLVPNGFKSATRDAEKLRFWWSRFPDANVGIRTGSATGFFVLDIDPRHGGEVTIDDLGAKHGEFPETVQQLTGGGGRHLLFKHPGEQVPTRNNALGPGIDVKGDGGYVVVEPSIHVSGDRYAWELSSHPDEVEIAEAPEWLLKLVVGDNSVSASNPAVGQTFKFDPSGSQEVVIAKAAMAALKQARADDYDIWVQVGMIMKTVDPGPANLDRWDQWSRQSPKYKPGECARKWATFNPNGELNLPTLIRWAHEDTDGQFRIERTKAAAGKTTSKRPTRLLPFQPFPTDTLPDPIRRFVHEGAAALVCDPVFIALPLLCALTAAIGNTRRILLKPTWCEPAILWGAIVGYSGTLKSPAIELALRPIRRRQSHALRQHDEAMQLYEDELDEYQRDLKAWQRSKHSEIPAKPQEPVAERYWCSDVTIEAIAPLLRDQPRGLLLARDEVAGWLRSHDAYKAGGGDTAHWLECFHGRSMLVDRKTGNQRTIHVPHASVSICGGIQPDVLREALGREHFVDGLAARLLVAMPPRRVKRWTDATIDPVVDAAVDAVFDYLYGLPFKGGAGDLQPVDLSLTDQGHETWIRFYERHAEKQAGLTGDLAAAYSKLEGLCARIALVIHFVRQAANDPDLADQDRVDDASVEAATILTRWFCHETERVYTYLAAGEDAQEHQQVIELIERRGGRITARELQQNCHQYRGSSEAAQAALDALVESGNGHWEERHPGPHGGRPTRDFVLNQVRSNETPDGDPARGFRSVDAVGRNDGESEEVVI